MRRALFVLLVACSSEPTVPPSHSGSNSLQIAAVDSVIVVPRGESVSAHVTVTTISPPATPLSISFGSLPQRVTSAPVTWTFADSPDVTLTVTADANAPQAELPIEMHVIANGTIVARADVTLAVSNVAGTPDVNFGGGVRLLMAGALPVAIATAPDGSFIVAGVGPAPHAFVARVATDGTVTSSRQIAPNGLVLAGAIASDGRVVFGVESTLEVYDQTDTLSSTIQLPFSAELVAWDGDAFFVAQASTVAHVDPQGATTSAAMTKIDTMTAGGPGVVYVHDADGLHRLIAASAALTIDSTFHAPDFFFDSQSIATVGSVTPDPSGALYVALSDASRIGVARLQSNGAIDEAYGSAGVAIAPAALATRREPLVVAPSGEAFVAGSVTNGGRVAGFDSHGAPMMSFGTFGQAPLGFGSATKVTQAVLDTTNNRLCITGETTTSSSVSTTYLTCLRL